jgi:hypothetical protein
VGRRATLGCANRQPKLAVGALLSALGLGSEEHLDAFIAHDLGHGLGHIYVFSGLSP